MAKSKVKTDNTIDNYEKSIDDYKVDTVIIDKIITKDLQKEYNEFVKNKIKGEN